MTAKTKMLDIASPCIDICALDSNNICMGCHRSSNEIATWMSLNDEQKRIVLETADQRSRTI